MKLITTLTPIYIIFSAFTALAAENSEILKKAEAGNLKALNQAFVLLKKSDGAEAEEIDMAIGKSIPVHPKNFLTALKKNRKHVQRLDATLGHLDDDFVDDFKKQKSELEKRLKAIQSVKDKSLKAIRTECEAELERQIKDRSRD